MTENVSHLCIGIDFGCRNIYVSVADGSSRETSLPTMTTLLNSNARNRNIIPLVCNSYGLLVGCDKGYFKYRQDPVHSVLFPKLFLGKGVEDVCSGYNYDIIEKVTTNSSGIAQFKMAHNDGTYSHISLLQAIRIIIKEIMGIINSSYSVIFYPHRHYVIGIPSYWNKEQIKEFRLALDETEMSDALFLYDIEAYSLNYGYYINSERRFSESDRYVMTIDIGYEHITVFCTHYSDNKFTILHEATSLSCGGRLVDQILIELVEEKLVKYGIDKNYIDSNPKFKAQIRETVEQSKVVFSSERSDSMVLSFSVSDMDITIEISSEEFIKQCKEHKFLQTIRYLCTTCLDEVGGVDEAILEGSGSRLWIVSNEVKSALETGNYPRKGVLKTTSNQEEDFCRGCCLSCICKTFPIHGGDPTISLPSKHILLNIASIPVENQMDSESKEAELVSSMNEWIVDERKFSALSSLKNEIYNMILACQNMLSEEKLPYWYRKDMLDYTKLLMLQLSISSRRDNSFYYEDLKDKVSLLKNEITNTIDSSRPVRIVYNGL